MSAVSPNPFQNNIPPPQTMAMAPATAYDDDDILMDYEDDIPQEAVAPLPAANGTNGLDDAIMDIEFENGLKDNTEEGNTMVPEKVHVRGVDNLSTAQVKQWVSEHFEAEVVGFEWIDDTSCNIVFETPGKAARALEALQDPSVTLEQLPLLALRPARNFTKSPNSRLQVRIARPTDRKEKGARERSRYYLFHPEEDRAEKFERDRRERRRPRRRSTSDDRDGNYSRRYYDEAEHDARRRGAQEFTEDFYDDDASARRRASRRTRSRSPGYRARSRSGQYRRRPVRRSRSPLPKRSGSPVELFPSKANNNIELFPEKARGTAVMDSYDYSISVSEHARDPIELFPDRAGPRREVKELFPVKTTAPHELFPEKAAPRELFPQKVAASRELFPEKAAPRELFSEKATTNRSNSARHASPPQRADNFNPFARPDVKPSLAERVTIPTRSLAERITGFPLDDGGGGMRIKGVASSSNGGGDGDDLFAARMMVGKGDRLFREGGDGGGGDGGRRRKGGRSKAQDHFG